MIIWGWRTREIEQSRGHFHCPQCQSEQPYRHVRVATYFTLYFIPLFPTQEHGQYVRCERCTSTFRDEVLEHVPQSREESLASEISTELKSGTPLQIVRAKLVSAGMQQDAAEEVVKNAAGKTRQCPSCNLVFVWSRVRCTACDGVLP